MQINIPASPLAAKIRDLRKSRALTQVQFAQIVGVRQSALARWEGGIDRPTAKTLLKISEMVSESERQWWRDQAAEQSGFKDSMPLPQVTDESLRMIPLLRDPVSAGVPRLTDEREVVRHIGFPREWLQPGGDLVALKIQGDSMNPLLANGFIVIVDLSKRRKEELVGKIVVARLDEEITIKKLQVVSGVYFLEPQNPEYEPMVIKRGSGWEILGPVVKWIGDSPGAIR